MQFWGQQTTKQHISQTQEDFKVFNLPPMVLSRASRNWSLTKRRTRLDLPTDASPNRTNLQWCILPTVLPSDCRVEPEAKWIDMFTCKWQVKDLFIVTNTLTNIDNIIWKHLSILYKCYNTLEEATLANLFRTKNEFYLHRHAHHI